MILTRENLRSLFFEHQEIDRQIKIEKIIEFIKEHVIKNAKRGETIYADNFNSSINDIKNELLTILNQLFPDSIIEIYEDYSNINSKSSGIIINWGG
jgi:hypothetical protein